MLTPPSYQATSTIIFPPQSSAGNGLLAQLSGMQSLLGGGSTLAPGTYAKIIKSRRLSQSVGEKLELDKLGINTRRLYRQVEVATPRDGSLEITCTVPSKWFKNVSNSEARKRAAKTAAAMADAYVGELKSFDQSVAFSTGKKNRVFIESELAKTKTRLTEAEEQFTKFREANPSVFPVDQSHTDIDNLANLKAKQMQSQAEFQEIEKRLASSIQVFAKEDREILSFQVLSDNPVMTDLRRRLADLEIKKATLLENVTDKHPEVVAVDQEIRMVREKMAGDVESRITSSQTLSINPVYQALQNQIVTQVVERAGIDARKSALESIMEEAEQGMTRMAGKQLDYVRLMRDLKALESLYTTLLSEYSKAQISEAREAENFQVLDVAEVPKSPSKPKSKLALIAATIFGFTLGSMIAVIQESTLPRYRKRTRIMTGN